jgi:hypothetical protein
MRCTLFSFLLLVSLPLFAQQFFPDFRNKRESLLKVGEKDVRADVVTFALTGVEENIHQDALPKLPMTGIEPTSLHFEGNAPYMNFQSVHIDVKITTAPFDSTKNKLNRSMGRLVKINNRPFYGNYGFTPATYINAITVIINKDTIDIPAGAYSDIFNPKFSYMDKQGVERSKCGVFLSADRRKIYIYLFTKDNSGGYEVTWVIQDKKYLRRIVDYDILN